MTWKEFFVFPLSIDENGGWVVCEPGNMGYRWAWDWIKNDFICEYPVDGHRGTELAKKIVDIVNGDSNEKLPYTFLVDLDNSHAEVFINGQPCMEIRSWGELTGRLKLSPNDAAKIQGDFCKYIVNRLNNPV